jgi:hypothetical protein
LSDGTLKNPEKLLKPEISLGNPEDLATLDLSQNA